MTSDNTVSYEEECDNNKKWSWWKWLIVFFVVLIIIYLIYSYFSYRNISKTLQQTNDKNAATMTPVNVNSNKNVSATMHEESLAVHTPVRAKVHTIRETTLSNAGTSGFIDETKSSSPPMNAIFGF